MRTNKNANRELTDAEMDELRTNAFNILCNVRKMTLDRFPFVGAIAMNLDLVPVRDERCPTASTDGAAIYWNIAFLAELTPEERMFVLAHEIYHNVMMHSFRAENRDHDMFNIACDLEVNQLLAHDGLTAPKDCCFIRDRQHPNGFQFEPDLSAEQYYELLLKDKKNRQQQHNAAKNGSGNDNSSSNDNGNSNAGNNNSKSLSGQFDKHINKNDDVENEPGTVASDKYGKVGRDPNFRPNATESNAQHIREAAISAVQMLERQHGTVPAHLKKLVNEMTEAKVDWKELLSQFITRNSGDGANTWNHPNRRFAYSGVYLPSHESQNMNIAVVLDTSGSVVNLLPQFLGELNGIVKSLGNYKLTVLQNDSKVRQVDEYTDEEPLDLDNVKFKAVGFGGTDLSSAFKHIEDNNIEVDCIVAMTDGEFSTLDPSLCDIPTLWLISENGTAEHITFGEICEYNN